MTQVRNIGKYVVSQKEFFISKAIDGVGVGNRRYAQGHNSVLRRAQMVMSQHGCFLKLGENVHRDITSEMIKKLSVISEYAPWGRDSMYAILNQVIGIARHQMDRDRAKHIKGKNYPVVLSIKQVSIINKRFKYAESVMNGGCDD